MIELMNEVTKKALEYGLSFCLLVGIAYHLNSQIEVQKVDYTKKIDALSERLETCELDRFGLAKQVEGMRVMIELFTNDGDKKAVKNKYKK